MSSRSQRRASRSSARSRRTPVQPQGESGFKVPWIPLAVAGGIAIVAALVVYLVAASDDPRGNEFSGAAQAEGDANPDIPGQFIDLQKIYGGVYGAPDGPTTAAHVSSDVDYAVACVAADEPTATEGATGEATSEASETEAATASATEAEAGGPTATAAPQICNSNPPAGGPHWNAACGESPSESGAICGPAQWGVYREAWEPETLVHNMEHGGIVIWYNTSNQQVIDELEEMALDLVDDDKIIVMAPYPGMEEETLAITSWSRIDKFPMSEYTRERVDRFINENLCRFNPEDLPGC